MSIVLDGEDDDAPAIETDGAEVGEPRSREDTFGLDFL